MMNVDHAFVEFDTDEPGSFSGIYELNIVSGGCHLYGYLLQPLARTLKEHGGRVAYESIASNHSFIGQRMKLTKLVGQWIEENFGCFFETNTYITGREVGI